VILVTRLNGRAFAVNPDLIERAEGTPDTVVTLVDGTKYVVVEPVLEIIDRIRDFRAAVIATASELENSYAESRYAESQRRGRVVALPTREA
jgi:flagellar protein FlbD